MSVCTPMTMMGHMTRARAACRLSKVSPRSNRSIAWWGANKTENVKKFEVSSFMIMDYVTLTGWAVFLYQTVHQATCTCTSGSACHRSSWHHNLKATLTCVFLRQRQCQSRSFGGTVATIASTPPGRLDFLSRWRTMLSKDGSNYQGMFLNLILRQIF